MASAVPPPYPIASGTNTVQVVPPAPGTYSLRIYDSTGKLLAQSLPFAVAPHVPQTYTVSAADALTLGDAASAAFIPASPVVDAIRLGDTASIKVVFAASAVDALSVTEAANIVGQNFAISDVITLGDTATANATMLASASDLVALTEAATAVSGGLLLIDEPISLTNPAGQPTQANPFFSFGVPIARSGFPSSGFKLALYDSTGVTKITDLQTDMTTAGWTADGSINYAVVSGYATGTTLTAGSTANFRLKAIAGSASTTPVCSLASLKAASDIKAKCKIGTDSFTVSVNTIISAPPVTSYPLHYVRQWKSGPQCCEWCFGAYLQRDSDGAYHTFAFIKLYVTALSASGPFIVRGYLENANTYGPHPSGTVGGNPGYSPQIVVDSIDVYNGSTLIGSLGGVNDQNNGAFAPSAVSLTTGEINPTFASGTLNASVLGNACCPIGFVSTGALPTGLAPASTTTYWAAVDGSNHQVIPMLSRVYASGIMGGPYVRLKTLASGQSVAKNAWWQANGGTYLCTTAGVSTGAQPTGTTFADNGSGGTLVWTLISAQITSQGTGSHTMVMKSVVCGGSKAPIIGADTYPFWNGSGSLPKLLIGYDRNYMFGQTKAFPPLDPSIVCASWIGSLPRYVQNVSYLPGQTNIWYIGNVGESTMDERINQMSPTAMASICLPTDQGMAMSCRFMALSFVDRNGHWRDERLLEVPVVNYGPDRLGGSYPNMPPTNSGLSISNTGSGNPKMFPFNGVWTGYGGFIGGSSAPDSGHSPNPYYWPALTTGDPMFHDALMEWAVFQIGVNAGQGRSGTRSALFNGVNLTWAWPLNIQTRSSGHCFQIFAQTEWIVPDAHPAKKYFSDVMDDSAAIGPLWSAANYGPNGRSVGYMQFVFPGTPIWQAQETWEMSYLQFAFLCEMLKGNRPGFASFYTSYFYKALLPLWDSDVGGTELIIDQQWDAIGNTNGNPAPYPPTESQFLLNVPDRLSGNPTIFKNLVPPIPTSPRLFFNGLQIDGSGPITYRQPGTGGAAFPGNVYGMTARAVCEMGTMYGFAYAQKIADRIQAVLDASYSSNPCNYSAQATSGNPNGIMYGMKRQ